MTTVVFGGETMELNAAMNEGFCFMSPDGQHCGHWWDCEPCDHCGYDGGGEAGDCSCPRHSPELYDAEGELIR